MSKATLYTGIAVAIAIVVVGYFFFIKNPSGQAQNLIPNSNQQQQTMPEGNPNSVVIQDVKVGTGVAATPGSHLTVSYVGKLQDGTIFDASANHGGTFPFTLGAGQVIPGWEQGIQGMKEGGERILVIPPTLGYGSQDIKDQSGNIVIPANSTLIFDVTLVNVSNGSTPSSSAGAGLEGPAAD
jgi:FKBP-type peptidyl-prolyl cis-trans isomerase